MPAYKKKYITLRDAAIISGYTQNELKNFVKIGLIPFRKAKNKLYIRFDAFEKIQEHKTGAEKPVAKALGKTPMKTNDTIKSLVPFTTPSQALVKILEPVAFTAALFMVFHLATIPRVAENVVASLDAPGKALAYMGTQVEELITSSVAIPVTLASAADSFNPIPARYTTTAAPAGLVAGTSTINGALPPTVSSSETAVERFFNGIADASDAYQRVINTVDQKASEVVFTSLRFEKVDPYLQAAFRW
jgi:hypothetical protein